MLLFQLSPTFPFVLFFLMARSKRTSDTGTASAGKARKSGPKSGGSGKRKQRRTRVTFARKKKKGVKKPFRFRPGVLAMRDIKRYQANTQCLLRRLPFQRVIREICQEWKSDARFQASALLALQEATEGFMIHLFSDMNSIALHANRVTVLRKDLALILGVFRKDINAHATPKTAPLDNNEAGLDAKDERVARMMQRRVRRAAWLKEDAERRSSRKKKK